MRTANNTMSARDVEIIIMDLLSKAPFVAGIDPSEPSKELPEKAYSYFLIEINSFKPTSF